MSEKSIVEFYDFHDQCMKEEKVFGESFLRWLYESRSGSILGQFLTRELPCSLYGLYKSKKSSVKDIPEFIKKFDIKMEEFENEEYNSFNDFFIRKLREDSRNFCMKETKLPAFCEGRYLIYNSPQDVPIKGAVINPLKFLGDEYGVDYTKSQVVICRLAPVDYHWFHFPDSGRFENNYSRDSKLDSVSSIAIGAKPDLLNTNKRQISILNTNNFGEVAMVEVGAFCVGTIQQVHKGPSFSRGNHKGYFLFGGSTVVLLIKNGGVEFNKQIIENSAQGIETYIKLGTPIGTKK